MFRSGARAVDIIREIKMLMSLVTGNTTVETIEKTVVMFEGNITDIVQILRAREACIRSSPTIAFGSPYTLAKG